MAIFLECVLNCCNCSEPVRLEEIVPPDGHPPADVESRFRLSADCDKCGKPNYIDVVGSAYSFEGTLTETGKTISFAFIDRQFVPPLLPVNALMRFEQAQADLNQLAREWGHRPSKMFERMLLMQCVSNFEVFASDSIISLITRDHETRVRLLRKREALSEVTKKLIEIEENSNLIRDTILADLGKLSFHNIRTMSQVFSDALGVDVLPKGEERAFLNKMLELRHDCVHRNGRTKDGDLIEELSPLFDRLMSVLFQVAGNISEAIGKVDKYRASKSVGELISKLHALPATKPLPDGTYLADVIPLPSVRRMEAWLYSPDAFEYDAATTPRHLWEGIINFDAEISLRLHSIHDISPISQDWLERLIEWRQIATEMLRSASVKTFE